MFKVAGQIFGLVAAMTGVVIFVWSALTVAAALT